jgi:hypothetical protein
MLQKNPEHSLNADLNDTRMHHVQDSRRLEFEPDGYQSDNERNTVK